MEVIYRAFDGTEFSDVDECEDYEWNKKHEDGLANVTLYDQNDNILSGILSEDTYDNVWYIVVDNEEGLKVLHDVADHTEFSEYYFIDSVGKWIWDKEESGFVHE